LGFALAILAFSVPAQAAPSARDGDGVLGISPALVSVGSASNAFAISFRNDKRGNFKAGSQLAVTVPAGWSAPQTADPTGPGYVAIASTSGTASASIFSVAGVGPWTVTVNFTASKGAANGFDLSYARVIPPAVTGTYAFASQTRQRGGKLTDLAASPTVSVAKGSQAIVFPAIPAQWATNVVELDATASSGLAPSYAVTAGPGTLSGANLSFSGAGSVVVVASQAGDANWNAAASVARTIAVSKVAATVSLAPLNQVYDGTARAVAAETDPAGLPATIAYNGSATPPTAAGSYAVAASVGNAWYQGSATGTLVVAKAPATVSLSGLAQVYDGAPKSVGVATVPAGRTVAITYAGSAAPPTAAGAYAVTATVVEANYAGSAAGTLVVAPAPAEVTLDELEQLYDGDPKSVEVETEPAGLPVTVTYDGAANPPTDVGPHAAAATVADPNYVGAATGTLLVVPEVELEDLEQTYDGAPKPVQVKTKPEGVTATVTYGGQSNVPVNAGRYAVTAIVCRASQCHGKAIGTLHVAKANQSVDFPAVGNQLATNVVALAATASSGLSVEYSVVAGPATVVDGSNLVFTGTGTVGVAAAQPGDGNWNAATSKTRTFDVADPPLEPVFSSTTVNVREAGEGRFFVRLNARPSADVVLSVARAAGSANLTVQSGATRTFKPSNWSTWQAVTLAAGDDADATDETATFRISAAGMADRFATATALDDDLAENLALAARGVAVAGVRAYQATQLIDGVHAASTNYGYVVWTSSPPGTLTLDLKATATVSRIRLLNWDWNFRSQRYAIDSSEDGTNWTRVADALAQDRQGWDDWPVAEQPMRYLRFIGTSNSANAYVCVSELEVYGVLPPPPWLEFSTGGVNVREGGEGRFFVRLGAAPTATVVVAVAPAGGSPNVVIQSGATRTFRPSNWNVWQAVVLAAGADADATSATATFRLSAPGREDRFIEATTLDDGPGRNLALSSGGSSIAGPGSRNGGQLIDGVHAASTNYGYATWTNAAPGTMTLDLKAEATVSRLRVLNWDWVHRFQRYKIESSTDGASWSLLADASDAGRHGWDDWPVADRIVRYLRFSALSNSANAYVCVSEWEVWGMLRPLPNPELSTTNVFVREDGSGRFFLRLTNAPLGNVVFHVERVGGDGVALRNGATRSFKAANWSTWQVVTLEAPADDNDAPETATFRISAPGMADQFVQATTLDDDVGENLALSANGSQIGWTKSGSVDKVIDGKHDLSANYGYSTWTNDPPGTMLLDMFAEMNVTHVRVQSWDWVPRFQSYKLEASRDGATWTLLADGSGAGRHGWDDWPVGGQPIRFLRLTALSNSVNAYVCISELEVYGTRPAAKRSLSPAAPRAGAISAASALWSEPVPVTVLTSAGVEDETGWNAVDGDEATAWTGQKVGGGYLLVEYQPALELSALDVVMSENSMTGIQCLYSMDARNWQPLPDDLESNPISLNYLWLIFPDDGTTAMPQVREIVPNP